MKRFNLTFRGEILPDYSDDQVKSRFTQLFALQDQNLIEEIFCGDTVILRSNLDRKTAAEYYMQINHAGAVAQLVSSDDQAHGQTGAARPLSAELTLITPLDSGQHAQLTKPPPYVPTVKQRTEQTWATPASDRNNLARAISADTEEEIAGLQFSAEVAEKNQQQELDRLDSFADKIRRDADAAQRELRNQGKSVNGTLQTTLTALKQQEEMAHDDYQQELDALQNNRKEGESQLRKNLQLLKQQAPAAVTGLDTEIASLNRQNTEQQQQWSADVVLLEQRLLALQQQLREEPAALELRVDKARQATEQKLAQFHASGEQALHELQAQKLQIEQRELQAGKDLDQLKNQIRENQLEANGKTVSDLARLKEQEAEAQRIADEKVAKLQERATEVRTVAEEKLSLLLSKEQQLRQKAIQP